MGFVEQVVRTNNLQYEMVTSVIKKKVIGDKYNYFQDLYLFGTYRCNFAKFSKGHKSRANSTIVTVTELFRIIIDN